MIAKVKFTPVGTHNYTGLFATESDTILMRLSEAQNLSANASGLTPSIALKWLVDGMHSQNLLAMEKFDSSGQWNFLGPRLTTRVPAFDTSTQQGYIMDQTVRKKISEATFRPFGTAVSHIARHTLEGARLRTRDAIVPYQIHLISPLADRISAEKQFDSNGDQVEWFD